MRDMEAADQRALMSLQKGTEPPWLVLRQYNLWGAALHHSVCCTAVCWPAGDTVSDSVAFTIGTDCVGGFGPFGTCSNVCGQGKYSRTFTVVSGSCVVFGWKSEIH